MATTTTEISSPPSPPLGALIDNGSLKLVELLGQGGYGIVYRALDVRSLVSYAVKCLPHAQACRSSRRRQLHLREIRLHKLASAHPNVVSLHRVVEDRDFTYIIMDYCEDGDLFTQILHNRRYLGQDGLIKHVFLQLLDSVEYCHSIGIYHRDLKPENVLCFDGGLRLAITDFGLATVDSVSEEFRTGSAYHMSPECHGGHFAPDGSYSPLFNDIWSLGIILLNLLTGRNPWKSASLNDPTFFAYLQDPLRFLPTVLPISDEVNSLLVRTLDVNWRNRITLSEIKAIVKSIDNFYSDDVVFDGSMARCTWEVGMDMGSESSESEIVEASKPKTPTFTDTKLDSQMVFASHITAGSSLSWRHSLSNDATCGIEASMRSSSFSATCISKAKWTESRDPSSFSPSGWSNSSRSSSPSVASFPVTPNDPSTLFRSNRLTINTVGCGTGYYRNSVTMLSDGSAASMFTAMESSSPSPASCLPNSSTTLYLKPSTPGFDDSDFASDAEMRDVLQEKLFIGEDSSLQTNKVEGFHLGLGLDTTDLKMIGDLDIQSESWQCSESKSLYKFGDAWTSAQASDSQSSLIYNEKSATSATSAFTFEPDLSFFGDDEFSDSSWPKSWSSSVFSVPYHENNNFTPPLPTSTKPIDVPMSTNPRPDRKRRKTGFFRDHIQLSFPGTTSSSSPSVQHETAIVCPSSPPATSHQSLLSSLMVEMVKYGDTSAHSSSWTRRETFGSRLSSRARKNWLLFSPGKLFGAPA